MKNIAFFLFALMCLAFASQAQVGINADQSEPDPSAGLDVKFINKGVLLPRMTLQQRNDILNPAEGLMVYCTNCGRLGAGGALSIFTNGAWTVIGPCSINPVTSGTHTVSPGQIIWRWTGTGSGVKWNTTNDFDNATDLGYVTSKTETGILCGQTYTRFVWNYSECGVAGVTSLIVTTAPVVPDAPLAGTQVPSMLQIVWNWNPATGATGYKWNTVNNYSTATTLGTVTSTTETGLNCGTSYTRYLWAFNTCGGTVSPTILTQATVNCPTCGQPITDVRDGKTYNTVLIGAQCWMAQNLNIGTKINGSWEQTNNQVIEKYCYSDLESNCDIYGGLYKWNEAMQYVTTPGVQGICPAGWHLPTDAEWTVLTTFLGGEDVAGGKMKETGTNHWSSPNTLATNSSGFTALPGGYRYDDGDFYDLADYAYFWSSSESSSSDAWDRILSCYDAIVYRFGNAKAWGFSGRCLKD